MEPLNLKGYEIIDWKHMKQTNRVRLVIELTEQDSNIFGGVTAVACQQHVIFNGEWNEQGIQGNNNGFEKSLEVGTKKEQTIYQRFKAKCLEYSGEEYYERVKKQLGVEHLKDLEPLYGAEILKEILQIQIAKINQKMGIPGSISVQEGKIYEYWKYLFDRLNYPQNAVQKNDLQNQEGRPTNV